MREYLKWDEKTITDFSEANINFLYNEGYVFTRIGKGVMHQTRSVRVDLSKFELSSENRRILKKTDGLELKAIALPYPEYHWNIGKMAKDFYEIKFKDKIFSANKIKELLTDSAKSNFNVLLIYSYTQPSGVAIPSPFRGGAGGVEGLTSMGYCIAYESDELLHYSYPFYKLGTIGNELKDIGMGMMLRAIIYAKEAHVKLPDGHHVAGGKKYIYLGSAQRPSDTYKMQFAGVEWFDGEEWRSDTEGLKKIL